MEIMANVLEEGLGTIISKQERVIKQYKELLDKIKNEINNEEEWTTDELNLLINIIEGKYFNEY